MLQCHLRVAHLHLPLSLCPFGLCSLLVWSMAQEKGVRVMKEVFLGPAFCSEKAGPENGAWAALGGTPAVPRRGQGATAGPCQ